MSIVSRNRPPFGERGEAIVYIGEIVTVGFRLQQSDGAGGWETQSYSGRVFGLRVYSDGGTTLVNVLGTLQSHADGDYIQCVITGEETTALAVGSYGWEFVEFVTGGRVVISGGSFKVATASAAAQASGSSGSGGSGTTLYTLRTDLGIINEHFMGAAGAAGQGVPTGGTTGQVLSKLSATNYDTTWTTVSGTGTVTSVAALTLGTTGTDLSSSVANGTTTPVITLNVPTASAANRGALSAADWTTFNDKQAGDADLTAIAALAPSNDDLIQRKAGAWTNRTPAQIKTDLALTKTDVGLSNVDNTADTAKPVSTLQAAADSAVASAAASALSGHATDTANPHSVTKTQVGLGNVENTALSTWSGSTNITTLGTISAGVWGGTAIAADKGGTGQTVYAVGDVLYAATTTTLGKLTAGTSGYVLTSNGAGTVPSWQSLGAGSATWGGVTGTLANQTDLQSALDGKQPLDSDLTAFAALTPTNDDIAQRKAGAWTNRTPAQFKTDLVLVKGDVGLGNVDNTTDAGKPVSTAQQTALDLKINTSAIGSTVQGYNANLASLAGLTLSANNLLYATGAGTLAQAAITAAGLALIDDADAAAMRTTLGLVIGTDVQAYDTDLGAIAALVSAANKVAYATGAGTWALADFSAAGRALVDDADAAAQRATLGLVIGTDVQARDADLDAIAALTSAADKLLYATGVSTWALADLTSFARTLLDDANAGAARTTLGLAIGTDVQAYSATLAAIVAGTYTGAASITTLGTITTGTWSGKFAPRVSANAAPASPLAWNSNNHDQIEITGLTGALTINADSGSPVAGQKMIFRIKDNGTARALTWTTGATGAFRAMGITLPTTTTLSKTTYVGCIYNATDSRWDAVATVTEA